MSGFDAVGLVGVVLLLSGYALTVLRWIDATQVPALALNFIGASLILLSLWRDFNLSAAVIEGAWALIALAGLIRHATARR